MRNANGLERISKILVLNPFYPDSRSFLQLFCYNEIQMRLSRVKTKNKTYDYIKPMVFEKDTAP